MIRLDVALRQWGLAPSRAKAQELLREGSVEIETVKGWQICEDESQLVSPDRPEKVRLRSKDAIEFVSRGGRKLAAALDQLKINVEGLRVLDVGLSTGGFADCLLKRGVDKIVGVDVGHDQLAAALKNEPRLEWHDGINARELQTRNFMQPWLGSGFDFVVIDVSFISLEVILPSVHAFIRPAGKLLALVKPQFEVSRAQHNRNGIVTDVELHRQVRDKIEKVARNLKMEVLDFVTCALPGQDGNQEYFLYAQK